MAPDPNFDNREVSTKDHGSTTDSSPQTLTGEEPHAEGSSATIEGLSSTIEDSQDSATENSETASSTSESSTTDNSVSGDESDPTSPSTTETTGLETDADSTMTTGTDVETETGGQTDTGDNPLPSQLVLGDSFLTEIINESAFDTSLRRCPAGHVAVAASGKLGSENWLGKMQLHCAAITLSGLVDPALVFGDITLLIEQGSTSANAGDWGLSCPPGKFIQGLTIATESSAVSQVSADCVRLAWVRDPKDGSVTGELIAEGRERVSDNLGKSDNGAEASVSCPEGHAATGLISQQAIFISGLGLECRPWSTNR